VTCGEREGIEGMNKLKREKKMKGNKLRMKRKRGRGNKKKARKEEIRKCVNEE
jgi:hypothetical protein